MHFNVIRVMCSGIFFSAFSLSDFIIWSSFWSWWGSPPARSTTFWSESWEQWCASWWWSSRFSITLLVACCLLSIFDAAPRTQWRRMADKTAPCTEICHLRAARADQQPPQPLSCRFEIFCGTSMLLFRVTTCTWELWQCTSTGGSRI